MLWGHTPKTNSQRKIVSANSYVGGDKNGKLGVKGDVNVAHPTMQIIFLKKVNKISKFSCCNMLLFQVTSIIIQRTLP